MSLGKRDIIEFAADKTGRTYIECSFVFGAFLDALVDRAVKGDDVFIRGFGAFRVKERKRVGCFPAPGTKIIDGKLEFRRLKSKKILTWKPYI